MSHSQICIMITILIYLGAMLYIGIRCSKSSNTVDDFYLGGRKLGPVVTAMSAEASDMSNWLLMGLPGLAYLTGSADAFWTATGLAIGTYINWLFIAKRLRCFSQTLDAITLPQFFFKRFRSKNRAISGFTAIMIVIFFVPYTASGFAACGKLFASLFGVSYHLALIISAIVIVSYCTLGGFLAASFTDLVQSIVMIMAIIIILSFGIYTAGGFSEVVENAQSLSGYLSLTQTYASGNETTTYSSLTIFSKSAWGLGYFGMPHILLRFMAIQDAAKLQLSRRIAVVWVLISLFIAISIGLVGNAMTAAGATPVLEGADSETLIIQVASLLSQNGVIFAVIAGLILSGILAATMSTADSQLLVASSSISQDLLQDTFHLRIPPHKSVWIARVTVILIAVVGVLMAFDPNSSVFEIVSFAWAGFGATFGPVILLSLFWKKTTHQGVLLGMLTGAAGVFVWKYLIRPFGGIWDIYELLPVFCVSIIVNIIVSHLTYTPDPDVENDFCHYMETVKKV